MTFFQRDFVDKFNNVPIIDLTSAISQAVTIVKDVSRIVFIISLVSLLTSLLVVFMISFYRRSFFILEYMKMFIVGLHYSAFNFFLSSNIIIYSFISMCLSSILSVFISYLVQKSFFEGGFVIDYFSLIVTSFVLILLSFLSCVFIRIPQLDLSKINNN